MVAVLVITSVNSLRRVPSPTQLLRVMGSMIFDSAANLLLTLIDDTSGEC